MFDLYLPAGVETFRYLGGHVHSKPWVQLTRDRSEPTNDPKLLAVSTQLNVVVFAAVVATVLKVRELNVRGWLTQSGYPPGLWAEATKSRKLPPETRGP